MRADFIKLASIRWLRANESAPRFPHDEEALSRQRTCAVRCAISNHELARILREAAANTQPLGMRVIPARRARTLNKASIKPAVYGERFVKRRGLFCMTVTSRQMSFEVA
jgi:hypothetical protein